MKAVVDLKEVENGQRWVCFDSTVSNFVLIVDILLFFP